MSFNKLPSIDHYWSTESYISNQGPRHVNTKSGLKELLYNIHLCDNDTADSNDKGDKVRPLIDHFNETFQNAVVNSPNQSIDEHMIKFKERLSMKQYVISKPIKWGFKFWFCCDRKTGHCYELHMYLVTLLIDFYCTLLFDNFVPSPKYPSK